MDIFDKVEFNNTFDLNNDFYSDLLAYAIPQAVSDLGSYWRTEPAEKIITENTFQYIWKNYPDVRKDLLSISINVASGGSRVKSLSKEYCLGFVENLYSLIDQDSDDIETNKLMVRLLPTVDKDFSYLDRLCKYSLNEDNIELYSLWKRAGLSSSSDSAFYDYLWGKVKREKGSVDRKQAILNAAFENNAVSDALLKKIAKSSPKSIKRIATRELSNKVNNSKHILERNKRRGDEHLVDIFTKDVANLEEKIMLFVDCIDSEVVSNLFDCLSKDNLPWLMPAASHHYWLSKRLQAKLDAPDET